MELTVLNMNGKSAGNAVNVSDDSFGADYKEALVHQVVVAYQAGGRSGTSAQKNRSAARGGGPNPGDRRERVVLVRALSEVLCGVVVEGPLQPLRATMSRK